ncbi:MAG: DUF2796 domain-containing protein [Candidatus Thiodiazotropha sp. DIVDIV]
MKAFKRGVISLSTILLVSSSGLFASEVEHEQHGSHVHGEAQLLVAIEGDSLEIEFLSPAMNIVGFEHQPRNEAQIEAIASATDTLKRPDLLFTISPAAKCTAESIEVESPPVDHEMHDHGIHHHEEEGHNDFTGHYHYKCTDIQQLERIGVELFKLFQGTEAIQAQTISKRGQQKIDLTPGHTTLEL